MRNTTRQLESIRTQIMDIFMTVEVEAVEKRRKIAATRYLRARRGIESHVESKRLASQIDDSLDDDPPHE